MSKYTNSFCLQDLELPAFLTSTISIIVSLPANFFPAPPTYHRYAELCFFFFPVMYCCAAFCTNAMIIREMASQRPAFVFRNPWDFFEINAYPGLIIGIHRYLHTGQIYTNSSPSVEKKHHQVPGYRPVIPPLLIQCCQDISQITLCFFFIKRHSGHP